MHLIEIYKAHKYRFYKIFYPQFQVGKFYTPPMKRYFADVTFLCITGEHWKPVSGGNGTRKCTTSADKNAALSVNQFAEAATGCDKSLFRYRTKEMYPNVFTEKCSIRKILKSIHTFLAFKGICNKEIPVSAKC